MPDSSDTILKLGRQPGRCPDCGSALPADGARCPRCGYSSGSPVWATDLNATPKADRLPVLVPADGTSSDIFDLRASVLLQLLPWGTCVSLVLRRPLILGRGTSEVEKVLDLTEFNALQHGVSRQHCMIQRRGLHLVVTDLDSTNGTYLNDQLLLPQREYVVAHGDRLILGTLHILVVFSMRGT